MHIFVPTATCNFSIDCSTSNTNKASWQSTCSSVPAVAWMVSNLILPKPWPVNCYEVLFGGPRLHPCNHGWRWWGKCWDFGVGFPEWWQTLEPFQHFVEQSVHILCKRREHCNIRLYITRKVCAVVLTANVSEHFLKVHSCNYDNNAVKFTAWLS